MKTVRKIILFTVVCSLLFGFCACGGNKTETLLVPTADELVAEYDSKKGTMIGAWGAPYHSYEAYRRSADMGLTHIFLESDQYRTLSPADEKENGSEDMLELEDWFTELGLKAVYQNGVGGSCENINTGNPYYSNYACSGMLNLCDEPFMSAMDKLEEYMLEFDKLYQNTDYKCFTNLWPESGAANVGANYSDYLRRYQEMLSKVTEGRRIMSVDVYPLIERGSALTVDASWLRNAYDVGASAKQINADFHIFIQSVGYTMHRRPETREEIGFQVWSNKCMGIQGYTYFTFAGNGSTDNWQYSPAVLKADSPTGEAWIESYYEGCRTVNRQVRALDPVYHSFNWDGVLYKQGTDAVTPDGGLNSLRSVALTANEGRAAFLKSISSRYGMVAGVFSGEFSTKNGGKETRNALLISNYTDPKDKVNNTVDLEFADATHALIYYKGQWRLGKLVAGKLELGIDCGEGAFVIPYRFSAGAAND